MASADAIQEGGEEMASSLPVTDDLLAEVFLRLPAAADLVRASAVCVSFRRLVTARPFVRRFRKLHTPPLLGFLDEDRTFHPAEQPHPSAPAASAAALAADFSFSFLPAPARGRAWVVQDSRDGRILLHTDEAAVFTETVVCDPLHRRYLMLPPIPDDLAASMEMEEDPQPPFGRDVFLVPPSGDEEEEEETSFRVIWMGQCKTKLFAFVFSSRTGRWRAVPPPRWTDLFPRLTPSADAVFLYRQHSYGRFYWISDSDAATDMLVLDTTRTRMEFSVAEPPRGGGEAEPLSGLSMAMVEAGEGRPGMFVLSKPPTDTDRFGVIPHVEEDTERFELSYSIRESIEDGGRWRQEKAFTLAPGYMLIGSTQRYLLLYKLRSYQSGFSTLDVKTFKLEKMCDATLYFFFNLLGYSNFPPSFLSLPTVSSGDEEEAEGMLVQGCAASSTA